MLWSKILVAYDGSELAKKSLDKALELQSMTSAKVGVVYVTEIPRMQRSMEKMQNEIEANDDRILKELEERLSGLSDKCAVEHLQGMEVSYALLEHAKKGGYDLIVIGSRGLTGIHEFIGSVSHAIIQHSTVPVLVVK